MQHETHSMTSVNTDGQQWWGWAPHSYNLQPHHPYPPTLSHPYTQRNFMHRNVLFFFPNHRDCRSEVIAVVWEHKKDRKWNVNSKCNTFLIYVLHLFRQLPGCSWKKNDLFINQIHYFSSLEEEKCLHHIFLSLHHWRKYFLHFFEYSFIYN